MPRYRIVVCGEPRVPLRDTQERAMRNAVRLKLANWDAAAREPRRRPGR